MNLPGYDPGSHAWLRPVRPHECAVLAELARLDNHEAPATTHVFTKNNELIGCASLAAVPLLLPWFHTERCTAKDSVALIYQMENALANMLPPMSEGVVCVPVAATSPFQPFVEKLGYVNAGTFTLAFKKVR